ncbi:MAG: hypothetical protein C4560_03620 [Nitrospiraceae bacterium]|nr:MAG: hypothetical protein C4560_03620 [Nitrospiraceae bacterium]
MKASKSLIIMLPVIIVLLGIVIYQYGYLRSQSELSSIREEEEMKTKILEKYIDLISRIPQMENELAAQRQRRESFNSELLKGETDSIVSAALQDMVKGIITGRGGKISGEMPGQAADMGSVKVITVSIDAAMPDVRALGDAIYSIETHTPSLFVKDLDVRIKDYKNPRELVVKMSVAAMTGGK